MEFNYMILQAYDFLELNKKENCELQIGGSDQWGNIVNGVDLIKRHSNQQTYGLTTPLITLATGAKMGKTENGAIWLGPPLTASGRNCGLPMSWMGGLHTLDGRGKQAATLSRILCTLTAGRAGGVL